MRREPHLSRPVHRASARARGLHCCLGRLYSSVRVRGEVGSRRHLSIDPIRLYFPPVVRRGEMGRIAPTLRANAAGAAVPWWRIGSITGIRTARFFVPNPSWQNFASTAGNSPGILRTRLEEVKWFAPRAQPGLSKPTFVFVEAQCHNIADSSSIFDFVGAFVRLCQSFGYPRLPDPWRRKAADILAALTVSDEEFPSPSTTHNSSSPSRPACSLT